MLDGRSDDKGSEDRQVAVASRAAQRPRLTGTHKRWHVVVGLWASLPHLAQGLFAGAVIMALSLLIHPHAFDWLERVMNL
jgi:hypothetical protein